MNILILGSSGVIGKNLTKFLKNKGYNVIEFDIKMGEIYDLRKVESINLLKMKIQEADYVFFLAFDVGGSKYLENINVLKYIDNNMSIMKNVFECINNKPFIFASTQMENMYCSYGALKRVGEMYTKSLNGVSVRFWNVYDKEDYDEKSHVITDFIYKAKNYGFIELMTNGEESRQFLHADDCSEGLFTIMNNHNELKNRDIALHLTNHIWSSILEVAEIIGKIYNCKILINKNKVDTLQTLHNEPDTFLSKYWSPSISLEDGIKSLL
tara:strand:+ start:5916 stop:6719 length:804 start_codon:yes stop_codon:yes gene_type:complete